VANLDVQVAVRLAESSVDGRDGRRFGPLRCTILYRPNSNISRETLRFVEERLQLVNEMSLRERLRRIGASSRVPAEFGREPIEATGETAFSLATLVPLVLILMTITGAVYPAIDLTAGERERKTLETLIAAPISRVSLLLAKYVAVVTVAVLTAMINLLAMTVTILSSGLGPFLFPEGISFAVLSNILGLLMLFAAFFSAVLLTLTSFARSFKEAQAYLIPVMLPGDFSRYLEFDAGYRIEWIVGGNAAGQHCLAGSRPLGREHGTRLGGVGDPIHDCLCRRGHHRRLKNLRK
jgi:sodium transport system permease protein